MTGTPGSPRPDRIAGPGPEPAPNDPAYRPRRLEPAPAAPRRRTSPQRRAGLLLGASMGIVAIALAWPLVSPQSAVVAPPQQAHDEPTPSALFTPLPQRSSGVSGVSGMSGGSGGSAPPGPGAPAPNVSPALDRPVPASTVPAPSIPTAAIPTPPEAGTPQAPAPALTTARPPVIPPPVLPPPVVPPAPPTSARPDPAAAIAAVADAVAAIEHPGSRNTLTRDWATASEGLASDALSPDAREGRVAAFEALVAATRHLTDAERVRIAQALATLRAAF